MKIAILGSLINKPGDMPLEGDWEHKGPVLKIEFSRISADGRLTLVIDPEHGADVKTLYVKSGRTELDDAVCDLMIREGTNKERIGKCTKQDSGHCDCSNIRDWLNDSDFDAVIWTNLKSNFENKGQRVAFSLENAFRYLESLPPACKANARDYINQAPQPTQTALRQHLTLKGWL